MAEKRKDDRGRNLPDGFSQRSDGRYQARFTYKGKRYTLYDMQLGELKRKVNQKRYELENGINVEIPKDMFLNQWFDLWLDHYRKDVKWSTIQKNYRHYHTFIKPYLGDMLLNDIRQVDILNAYGKLSDKGCTGSTVKSVNDTLSPLMRAAYKNKLIQSNPCDEINQYIKNARNNKHIIALTEPQQRLFFEYLNKLDVPYRRIFVIGFGTGMRVGEICSLTWSDVDFDNNFIDINKTLVYDNDYLGNGKKKMVINEPKTKQSIRKVPMLDKVRQALIEQKELQKMNPRAQCVIDGYTNFVFTTRTGKPVINSDIFHTIIRVVDKINKDEKERAIKEKREPIFFPHFSSHTMRHTFATRAFEKGVKPKAVQEILGHASIKITLDIYTDLTEEVKKDEIKLLENMDL